MTKNSAIDSGNRKQSIKDNKLIKGDFKEDRDF